MKVVTSRGTVEIPVEATGTITVQPEFPNPDLWYEAELIGQTYPITELHKAAHGGYIVFFDAGVRPSGLNSRVWAFTSDFYTRSGGSYFGVQTSADLEDIYAQALNEAIGLKGGN
jgi:hypothetical protein